MRCLGYRLPPLHSSRMPQFNAEDQAELDKIMAGDYWEDDMPDFSDNLKKKPRAAPKATDPPVSPPPSSYETNRNIMKPNSQSSKKVLPPNADWRSAASQPPSAVSVQRKDVVKQPNNTPDYFSFVDLDYDDFEKAMREEEMGGMNPGGGGSKISAAPVLREGLISGDAIPTRVWDILRDAEGNPFKFTRLHKEQHDVAVIYVDPRRMTDEFKIILDEFNKLPLASLNICSAAINCDESNDHRKFLKRNTLSCSLLTDPSKKVNRGRICCLLTF